MRVATSLLQEPNFDITTQLIVVSGIVPICAEKSRVPAALQEFYPIAAFVTITHLFHPHLLRSSRSLKALGFTPLLNFESTAPPSTASSGIPTSSCPGPLVSIPGTPSYAEPSLLLVESMAPSPVAAAGLRIDAPVFMSRWLVPRAEAPVFTPHKRPLRAIAPVFVPRRFFLRGDAPVFSPP
ncbi:hypothetical protein C8R44DRAFT_889933 [Mycena epipterygia]|nr:hypothetical protein C8R44DRAFT_889933 [Mycena epipterygia]